MGQQTHNPTCHILLTKFLDNQVHRWLWIPLKIELFLWWAKVLWHMFEVQMSLQPWRWSGGSLTFFNLILVSVVFQSFGIYWNGPRQDIFQQNMFEQIMPPESWWSPGAIHISGPANLRWGRVRGITYWKILFSGYIVTWFLSRKSRNRQSHALNGNTVNKKKTISRNSEKLSRALTAVLRHNAVKLGLEM